MIVIRWTSENEKLRRKDLTNEIFEKILDDGERAKRVKGEEKQMKEELKNQKAITLIALIITILFSYDEMIKFSNSKGFLLATI